MVRKPPRNRDIAARNLEFLMQKHDLSEAEIAERVKRNGYTFSSKTVNNIRNARKACNLDKLDALASAFPGLEGWQFLMPGLPEDVVGTPSLSKLYKSYTAASPEGREMIQKVAEREAQYTTKRDAS